MHEGGGGGGGGKDLAEWWVEGVSERLEINGQNSISSAAVVRLPTSGLDQKIPRCPSENSID